MKGKIIHQGRNIKKIREIKGIKQEALAADLGLSQQAVSLLEQRESLGSKTLEKVADALMVSEETIKNFNEAAAVQFISSGFPYGEKAALLTDRPVLSIVKVVELYERMLREKDEKIELLKRKAAEVHVEF